MILNDNVIGVASGRLARHAAVQVVVAEGDGELELSVDVFHAGFGAALGVDLSVEEGGGEDVGDHVSGVALDGHVVAGRQLVGGGFFNGEVGLFNLETKKRIKFASLSLSLYMYQTFSPSVCFIVYLSVFLSL